MPPFTNGLLCLNRSSNVNAKVRVLWAATAVAATVLIAALTLAGAAPAFATDRISVTPGPDGPITVISEPDANGTRYLAGGFNNFDVINTGPGAMTDGTTGAINMSFTRVGFSGINAVAADGSGGVYIASDYSSYVDDALTLNGVAHINADGSLDRSWHPNVGNGNGMVRGIAVSGSTVYVVGYFQTAGGAPRKNAAAFDRTTGALKDWDPNATGASDYVQSLTVSGSTVYLIGYFTTVGGVPRPGLAAVDATTGADTGWDPNVAYGSVVSLAVSGSTVYLSGSFATVGGATRNGAAAVDATTGAVTGWDPNATYNGAPAPAVNAITISGSTIYLVGAFDHLGSASRSGAGAVDATTGAAAGWDPNVKELGSVSRIAVSGSTVYLGGGFTAVGGVARRNAAAVGTDGSLKSWNPSPASSVQGLVVSGSNVYIGGSYASVGGKQRRYVAALGSDGKITSWNPILDGAVSTISVSGSTVLLGGAFRNVNGIQRDYFAAIGIDGTLLAPWPGGPATDPTPTPPPTPDPTPATKPTKPAATWSSSAKAKTVTAVITPVTGVTYTLTATSGRVKKTGSCKNLTITQGKKKLARRSCTVKLAKGKWLASVTPKKGSVSGTVNSKSYSFK